MRDRVPPAAVPGGLAGRDLCARRARVRRRVPRERRHQLRAGRDAAGRGVHDLLAGDRRRDRLRPGGARVGRAAGARRRGVSGRRPAPRRRRADVRARDDHDRRRDRRHRAHRGAVRRRPAAARRSVGVVVVSRRRRDDHLGQALGHRRDGRRAGRVLRVRPLHALGPCDAGHRRGRGGDAVARRPGGARPPHHLGAGRDRSRRSAGCSSRAFRARRSRRSATPRCGRSRRSSSAGCAARPAPSSAACSSA